MNDPRITHDDRGMILRPDLWPHVYLPLKRRDENGSLRCAVLKSAVTEKNIRHAKERNEEVEFHVDVNQTIFGMAIGEVEHVVYPNVDALLADGWKVD